MKRFILFITIFVCALNINAQKKFNPQKFRTELHQYIRSSASLTDDEAAKFFPIYDEMKERQRAIHKQIRQYKKCNAATESEARNAIIMTDDLNINMKQVEKEYHQKMLKVLSALKLNAVLKAERKFHRQYFKKTTK